MVIASNGQTFTQMPQPMQSGSEMTASLSSPRTYALLAVDVHRAVLDAL